MTVRRHIYTVRNDDKGKDGKRNAGNTDDGSVSERKGKI